MGFSPPKDSRNLSLEEKKNSYLEAQASNVLVDLVSDAVILAIMPFRSAHEFWTKIQDKYDMSNNIEDDCIPSTSDRDELSSTSPKCIKTQGNSMVSGDGNCNVDSELTCNDHSSLSHCHASSLDLNTSSTINALHACVDSPCISCASCTNKSHNDMLDLSCFHDSNIYTSSSCCASNNVEENKYSMGQDKILIRASSDSSSSSLGSHMCLMARSSKVTPTLEPNISNDDNEEDNDDGVSLSDKGEIVFHAIRKNKIACSNFYEILAIATESEKIIEKHEDTIFNMQDHARDYADEIAELKEALYEEQTTKESLEETFTLELSKVKKSHEGALEVANALEIKYNELEVSHAKLLEDFELLKIELTKLPSPLDIIDDACATNSTPCEASIIKENVELRAQLELLTSKYGKLKETHEKLSSSNEDLLVSHARLELAHEAISTKVTSCEPHAATSTISSKNVILSCVSHSNSSTQNVAISCDELPSMPCHSNNEASTSSSTCVVTNHVEEIKELKARVSSLKKDLVKSQEGKSALNKILSVQKSPNDKSGLGFKSNIKSKSKILNKKKGQGQVKDPAKIVCFKCKIEGHHVRSCPFKIKSLSEKQQGKRHQVQGHAQPRVEEKSFPKKNQANAPIVEKSSEKKEKKRTCYTCREKGHLSSSCTMGNSSNPIIIDDAYSLCKDEIGNVFAKYVGTQSGVKKRTIWVAKPIVTNLLGPNFVGDQQAKT